MNLFKYFTPAIFLFACNTGIQKDNAPGTSANNDSNNLSRVIFHTDTVYITRNAEITPNNAYSDLFLDSTAIAQFILDKKLNADNEKSFKSFYNYRNFQFAWFTSDGFTEEAKGFWNLQDQLGFKSDNALRKQMDTLLNMLSLSISRFDTSIITTELSLTNAYLEFFNINRDKTQFGTLSPEKAIPVKRQDIFVLADKLGQQYMDTSTNGISRQYQLLNQKLQLYTAVAKAGGWQPIIFTGKKIKKGTASPVIALIKRRLQKTGDMAGEDTSKVFNDSLVTALKNYQIRNGLRPTGNITDTLVRSLNVHIDKRIEQIIINLNRMQWMPAIENENYISVNIPDFLLSVFENKAKEFDIPVAVGKEGTNTTIFTGDLNQIVFSPYWNIPASIVRNEIMPKIKTDPNYLKSRNMEIVGKNDTLPSIRQLPGKDNALGKIKFLFPNRYDIYLHDTNAKDIFGKDKRDVSHGCIRLADAEKLANYLLRNTNSWTPEKVKIAMNGGKEQFVKLSSAVPVVITYYTAWVDENGQLNFRDDVYANDKRVAQMMFVN